MEKAGDDSMKEYHEICKISDDESVVIVRKTQPPQDETIKTNFNFIVKITNGPENEDIEMWKHFVSLDNGSALCGHCSKIFNTRRPNAMAKLITHLKENHDRHTEPLVMKAMKTYNKPTAPCVVSNVKKVYVKKPVDAIRQPTANVQNAVPFTTVYSTPSTSKQMNIQDTQQIPKTLWKHYVYIDNNAKCGYCGISISLKQSPDVLKKLVDHLLSRHKVTIDREIIDGYMKSIMPSEHLVSSPSPIKIAKVEIIETNPKVKMENELLIPSNEPQTIEIINNDTLLNTPIIIQIADDEVQQLSMLPSSLDLELPTIPNWDGLLNHEIIVKLIVKNFYNLSIINDPNFEAFTTKLDPKYRLMANALSLENHHLGKLYDKLRKELYEKKLASVSAVTLTVEEYKLSDGRVFMDFIAHFIDDKCILQTHTLECVQVPDPGDQSGLFLTVAINKILAEWMIKEKLVTVVLKPGQNLDNINEISCFSSAMETTIMKIFNEIPSILDTIRQVATIFRNHETAGIDFKNIQEVLNPALPQITLDDNSNWITTCKMLMQFYENKEALGNYQPLFFVPELINSEWNILEHVNRICEMFYQIHMDMCDIKYALLSKVIFYIDCINDLINEYTNSTFVPSEVTQIISVMSTEMCNYKLTNLHLESSLLDPRFKKTIFRNEKNFQVAYDSVCKITDSIVMQTDCEEEIINLPTDNKSIWYNWDTQFVETHMNEKREKGKAELDKYLKEPLLSRNSDPLQWWKSREAFYPRLFQIMLNRMCIVANSIPASRLVNESEIKKIKRRQYISKAYRKYSFIHGNIS